MRMLIMAMTICVVSLFENVVAGEISLDDGIYLEVLSATQRNSKLIPKECHGRHVEKPYHIVCLLVKLYSNKDENIVLKKLQETNVQSMLWASDAFVYRLKETYVSEFPEAWAEKSLTDDIVSEVFRRLKNGEKLAIETYGSLLLSADGEYAEFMDEQLYSLFKNDVDMVVEMWPEIKKFEDKIKLGTTPFYLESDAIISQYEKRCQTKEACRALIDFLVRKKASLREMNSAR